jgi:ubiquinone/menaquinone biosynthesis C-methylase UbiE
VEAEILRSSLRTVRFNRVLEVGCGVGRLRPVFRGLSTSYVGVDLDHRVLEIGRNGVGRGDKSDFLQGDALRLPFEDSTFSAILMIRVYHRFSDPAGALAEAARTLEPGGTLIVSVVHQRSLAMFLHDVLTSVRQPGQFSGVTLSAKSRVEVKSGTNPGFVETLGSTRSKLRAQGFEIRQEIGSGFEDLPGLSAIPEIFWVKLSRAFHGSGLFPTVTLVAVRRGSNGPARPEYASIAAAAEGRITR